MEEFLPHVQLQAFGVEKFDANIEHGLPNIGHILKNLVVPVVVVDRAAAGSEWFIDSGQYHLESILVRNPVITGYLIWHRSHPRRSYQVIIGVAFVSERNAVGVQDVSAIVLYVANVFCKLFPIFRSQVSMKNFASVLLHEVLIPGRYFNPEPYVLDVLFSHLRYPYAGQTGTGNVAQKRGIIVFQEEGYNSFRYGHALTTGRPRD